MMEARCAGVIVVAGAAGVEATANALIRFITATSKIAAEKIVQVHGFARTAGEIEGNTTILEQAGKLGRNMAEELLKR